MSPREAKYRKEEVLAEIVEAYLETGVPVSSQQVVERGLECSSATIRNIMAELTEEGYLIQLHTSSGRVPTEKAYRYYLDYVLDAGIERMKDRSLKRHLTRAERQIEEEAKRRESVEDLLRITADLISELAHQTGMSVVWGRRDVYLHGRNYIIDYQEFQDLKKLKDLLTLFEAVDVLYDIFWRDLRDRVDVFIGEEIGIPELRECSMLISYCGKVEEKETRLGLVGPMRMDYAKNITLLEEISKELEELWKDF